MWMVQWTDMDRFPVVEGDRQLINDSTGSYPSEDEESVKKSRDLLQKFAAAGTAVAFNATVVSLPKRTHGRHSSLRLENPYMKKTLNVGDHVTWNSEAGQVSGRIIKVHTSDVDYKGYTHHASADDPQYEIKSDTTEHVAMHKGSALKRIAAK